MATQNNLWTRDFTIITLGSAVSIIGNSVSGFTISVIILEKFESVFLYSLMLTAFYLPKLIMPMLSGPFLDKYPRKKIIYSLDFISCALYTCMFFLVFFDLNIFVLYFLLAFIIGSVDSVYIVAYDSLYPNLVTEGNMSKAYSISSILYPISAFSTPIAYLFVNKGMGAFLFLFSAAAFLIAAIFEVQIQYDEKHVSKIGKSSIATYFDDFRHGVKYIISERGLLVITAFFFCSQLCGSGVSAVLLPYFKSNESLGYVSYIIVTSTGMLGRTLGGGFHYIKKIKPDYKYAIALFVYIANAFIDGTYLFTPIAVMVTLSFINGFICVTSYNIRISGTQDYVPDSIRARFNGVFQTVLNTGSIIGTLTAGGLGDRFNTRLVISGFMAVCLIAVLTIMLPFGKHVKKVYNRDI